MAYIEVFLLTLITYFIGSLSFAVIYSKLFYGIDIREHGLGSDSWRNVQLVIGKGPAWTVAAGETIKLFIVPLILMMIAMWGGGFSRVEYPVFFLSFYAAAWSGAHFPMFRPARKGKHQFFVFAGKHALNFGAVIVCLMLGNVLYFVFRNETDFYHYLHGGGIQTNTLLKLYLYTFVTLLGVYTFFRKELQTLHHQTLAQMSELLRVRK